MGAALSKTGLDRRTPLATATLVVAANAPDVDVLSYARGEYFALAFRRGVTHGLPAQLLLPFLVAGGILAWDRWIRRRRKPSADPAVPREILLLSFLGVLTHPALDWMNVYGMRWWLPFDGSWSYGDVLFIVDPWLWMLLGSCVFLAGAGGPLLWGTLAVLTTGLMITGPVPGVAAGAWGAGLALAVLLRRRRRPGSPGGVRAMARGAVAASAAYVALMAAGAGVGSRATLDLARDMGLSAAEVMLSPAPGDPFASEVEVVTGDSYVPGAHRWLPTPGAVLRPEDAVPFLRHPPEMDPRTVEAVLEAARRDPDVRSYLVWSRYPYAVVTPDGDGWRVRYSDARYDGREGAGGLGGVAVRVPPLP